MRDNSAEKFLHLYVTYRKEERKLLSLFDYASYTTPQTARFENAPKTHLFIYKNVELIPGIRETHLGLDNLKLY